MPRGPLNPAFARQHNLTGARGGRGGTSGGGGTANANSTDNLLRRACASGSLNLSNRQLAMIPPAALALADTIDAGAAGAASWDDDKDNAPRFWESVDLAKLDLSHNVIDELPLCQGSQCCSSPTTA